MSALDLGIILVYMAVMVLIGIACRGKQENESDYFTGHGGFSRFWGSVLVGLSIAATFFSGISMLAYPSIAYQKGIVVLMAAVVLSAAGLLTYQWFLPRFLRTGTREPYEIVERRFGYSTRVLMAVMFLLLRVSWMGTLIYAPTIALMGGFGLEQKWFWGIVLGIGLTSTFYTVFGGIRGVIVTDAIQFLVIVAGILWPVVTVLLRLNLGGSTVWNFLRESGRLDSFSFSLSPTEPLTFWSMLFGFLVANLGMYLADQMALQRYLASEDLRAARKAFLFNICGVVIVVTLLVVMGISLVLFYGTVKPGQAPLSADEIFPRFIATELPPGVPGLIFAAILAATMSSMTSGTNALAGTIVLDFLARSPHFSGSKRRLKTARLLSLGIGLVATLAAGVIGRLGSIFDIAQALTGVFLGPMLVCMVLSVSSLQVSRIAVQAGMLLGVVSGWGIILTPADRLWVGPVALLASLIIPAGSLLWQMSLHAAEAVSAAVREP